MKFQNIKTKLVMALETNIIGSFFLKIILILRTWVCRYFRKHLKENHINNFELPASGRIYNLQASKRPTFFGYYDKSPFSKNGEKVLAVVLQEGKDWKRKSIRSALDVGYFDWKDVKSGKSSFNSVGLTNCWSWQQGCMLQWFPSSSNENVLYNIISNNQYKSVVQNIHTKEIVKQYEMPLYSLDLKAKFASSLNFSRLEYFRPGYGYSLLPSGNLNEKAPTRDGIWLINTSNGFAKLVITLNDLSDYHKTSSMEGAHHYVNHVQFNPEGTEFLFLHLWQNASGNKEGRLNRLLKYNIKSNNLSVVESDGIVSHFNWISNARIIATKFTHQNGFNYYLYDLSHKGIKKTRINANFLKSDGHPSLSPDCRLLLTDTYPDKYAEQDLLIIDFKSMTILHKFVFQSPFKYRGLLRCDLHPRWDHQGKRVCFDSTHIGQRGLFIIDLENAINVQQQ